MRFGLSLVEEPESSGPGSPRHRDDPLPAQGPLDLTTSEPQM